MAYIMVLFVLITMPPEIKMINDEFNKCKNISKVIDYVFKTEDLIRPYYAEEEEEK